MTDSDAPESSTGLIMSTHETKLAFEESASEACSDVYSPISNKEFRFQKSPIVSIRSRESDTGRTPFRTTSTSSTVSHSSSRGFITTPVSKAF